MVAGGSRGTKKKQEQDDASVTTASGGTAVGFTTADSIRQSLLPSLPSGFDLHAIEVQVRTP